MPCNFVSIESRVPEADGICFSSLLAPSQFTQHVRPFLYCAASPDKTVRGLWGGLEAGSLSLPGSGWRQLTLRLLWRASPILVRSQRMCQAKQIVLEVKKLKVF